jgi:ABC-type Fe3+ transport system substrate-binding protein
MAHFTKFWRTCGAILSVLVAFCIGLTGCGSGSDTNQADPQKVEPTELPANLPPEIRQAAEKAQELGMIFLTSHDEIVQKAKEGPALNGYVSSDVAEKIAEAFTAKTGIPATLADFSGTDAYQRFLLEADSGSLQDVDVQQAPPEEYEAFRALMAPYDILGMAQAGILDIPSEMIDPQNRNVVAVGSQIAGYAFNPKMLNQKDIPTTWEGFCDTGFLKGQKFMLDLRPSNMAPMVANWGMDRVLKLADCLKATDPILTRGTTDALTRVAAGEVPLHIFTNYHSTIRAMEDAGDNLQVGLIDPVPVRLSNALGVMNDQIAKNPYAGLLLIEFMASPEGQVLLDEDPLKSSIYAPSSKVAAAVKGHETSGGGFDNYVQMETWMDQIANALGFPQN